MADDEIEDEFDDYSHLTKWAFLVNPDKGTWYITRISEGSKIGKFEHDMSRDNDEWYVAAFFDEDAVSFIKALEKIGGHSLDGREEISLLLHRTIESFLESQKKLKEWMVKRPEVK